MCYGIKDTATDRNFWYKNGQTIAWDREEFFKYGSRHDAMEDLRTMGLCGNDRYIIMAESDLNRKKG